MRISRKGRAAAIGGVVVLAGYVGLRVTNALWPEPRRDEAAPPPATTDPANPAVLIPGGVVAGQSRVAGAPRGPRATREEGLRGMRVAPFWIQVHEVTNAEYARFDTAHVFPEGQARFPVVNVTFEEAMAYANWLGGLLPSEPEWEFAASGPEGRRYPWGDDEPTCERARFGGCGERWAVEVMSHPSGATPEGIHDMAGNVWEWVTPGWYRHGRTPVNDEVRRMRGGSFDDEPFFLRTANRSNGFRAGHRYISTGFRVAWPADGG